MDVKDLMIGDWVNYSILNLNAKVFSILGNHTIGIQFIDKNNKVEAIHGLLEEVIRPIPLTEDILVKNGFHKVPPHQLGRHTTYDLFKFKTNFMLTRKDEGNIIYDRNITVTYVHQLQHLLRLVGVQKEIEP